MKENRKDIKPGNVFDLVLVKKQIGTEEPVIAMGLMPGQQMNGHVPAYIPEPCGFEMIEIVPQWGAGVSILFISPAKSPPKKK